MNISTPAAVVLLAVGAGALQAGELEGSLQVGQAIPFYEQSFSYDPGHLRPSLPGLTLDESGTFSLRAKGGLALGAAVAYYFNPHAGVQVRLDTADVRVTTEGARYRLRADLPAPLPDLDTEIDLGRGSVDLERLRPLSLDVVLRGGPAKHRVFVSAGASFLPSFRFQVEQPVGIAVPAILGGGTLDLAGITVGADALPSESGGRWGVNGGAGLQVALGGRAALTIEARYFQFQERTLVWGSRGGSGASALEEAIAREIASALPPVTFNPRFFHAAAGVAVRF